MTRKSKRELERQLAELEESTTREPHPVVATWRDQGAEIPAKYDGDLPGAIMHNLRAYHDDVHGGGVAR
ncbi:hypothetical protein [Halorussus halobius]|uniref:hypothetical protein n=1 Tax=Halorussus halobius TaxID=1710537 RepID=UPI001092DCC1|nr:hypothetical protein [Halorussus halobius]